MMTVIFYAIVAVFLFSAGWHAAIRFYRQALNKWALDNKTILHKIIDETENFNDHTFNIESLIVELSSHGAVIVQRTAIQNIMILIDGYKKNENLTAEN